jgi:hypothetical protein
MEIDVKLLAEAPDVIRRCFQLRNVPGDTKLFTTTFYQLTKALSSCAAFASQTQVMLEEVLPIRVTETSAHLC